MDHRPWPGYKKCFFYNGENLSLIQDAMQLYAAGFVIFTNQMRENGASLRGRIIFDREISLEGGPTASFSSLKLGFASGQFYHFTDEYSFWAWNQAAGNSVLSGHAKIA